jgi:hypothetical protein
VVELSLEIALKEKPMTLMKRMSEKLGQMRSKEPRLLQIFSDLEGSPEFPFNLALNTFEEIQASSANTQELLGHLLEDVLVSSLYATFYEEILNTIHENPDVSVQLVNRFSEDQTMREQIIATQAHAHLNFIVTGGTCPGCPHCDNHKDVADLVSYWKNQDFKFFVTLYMGMQTIQYTMEYILYDVIPTCQDYAEDVSRESVLKLRQAVYDYVENKLDLD